MQSELVVVRSGDGYRAISLRRESDGTWTSPGWITLSRQGNELSATLKAITPAGVPIGVAHHWVIDYLPATRHLQLIETPGAAQPLEFQRSSSATALPSPVNFAGPTAYPGQ